MSSPPAFMDVLVKNARKANALVSGIVPQAGGFPYKKK